MYNNVANFNLKKFNIDTILEHSAICCISSRGSGKSFLVRELLYHNRDMTTVIIAPTDRMNGFYNEFVPSSFIHYEYTSELLSKIFARQMEVIEKNKERIKKGKKPIDDRLLLVMDDCLASKGTWMKDQNILELMQNGRHHKVKYILTMQFSLGISPELRSNFDYIFLLGEDFMSNQKRLYEHYAGMFPSFDIFKRVFTKVTSNFGCMVINNRRKGGEIIDKVFWYKANQTPNFIIGPKKYLTFHQKYFKPNWMTVSKKFNIEDYLNKKSKCNLEVQLDD
jgi:hypothetical protein